MINARPRNQPPLRECRMPEVSRRAKLAPGPPPGRAELDDEAPGEVLRLYLAPLFSAYPIPKVGPLGHARDGTTPKVGFPLFGETNPMCA